MGQGDPHLKTIKIINSLKKNLNKQNILARPKTVNKFYLELINQLQLVMKEISRLHEIAFRKVGEGIGKHLSLNKFPQHYCHLIL